MNKEEIKDLLYDIITSEINDIEGDYEGFTSAFNGVDTDEVVKTILNGIMVKFNNKVNDEYE